MSDPDLYNWEDPARRFAAQQREFLRKQQAEKSTKRQYPLDDSRLRDGKSQTQKQNFPFLTGIANTIVWIAQLDSHKDQVNDEKVTGTEEKKQKTSEETDDVLKAFVLFMLGITGLMVITNYGSETDNRTTQHKKERYPAVAVAFNKGNQSFVSSSVSYETAAKAAISECKRKSANPFSCEVKGKVPAGQPVCIDYGAAVTMQRYMSNNMPNYRIVGAKYFIGFTTDKSQPNTATAACLKELGYNGECTKYYGRTCNFN